MSLVLGHAAGPNLQKGYRAKRPRLLAPWQSAYALKRMKEQRADSTIESMAGGASKLEKTSTEQEAEPSQQQSAANTAARAADRLAVVAAGNVQVAHASFSKHVPQDEHAIDGQQLADADPYPSINKGSHTARGEEEQCSGANSIKVRLGLESLDKHQREVVEMRKKTLEEVASFIGRFLSVVRVAMRQILVSDCPSKSVPIHQVLRNGSVSALKRTAGLLGFSTWHDFWAYYAGDLSTVTVLHQGPGLSEITPVPGPACQSIAGPAFPVDIQFAHCVGVGTSFKQKRKSLVQRVLKSKDRQPVAWGGEHSREIESSVRGFVCWAMQDIACRLNMGMVLGPLDGLIKDEMMHCFVQCFRCQHQDGKHQAIAGINNAGHCSFCKGEESESKSADTCVPCLGDMVTDLVICRQAFQIEILWPRPGVSYDVLGPWSDHAASTGERGRPKWVSPDICGMHASRLNLMCHVVSNELEDSLPPVCMEYMLKYSSRAA
ncbi:unnamed protein product [Ostreobium quekettii]|uniref:Uncharacterized protein n=1 Tax=Ostreobium quekettii TaxID=121088 RepID=A0A8S1JBP4_9CHLO|nr:unnamed protein product [Ostreobium quekettii]|eukprot:evm.model.scf_847EXC.6 EVM.evm.TU.scf_847EXC.6   scf_847EXC:33680-35574(+)